MEPAGGRAWVDCSCGLALAMFLASSAPAAPESDLTQRNEALAVTLLVYNYAHVTPALLKRSEGVASSIFAEAGLTIRWVDCPVSAGEVGQYPKCHEALSSADFTLRILPQAMAETLLSAGEVMGSARECLPRARNCSADVYPYRVAGLAVGGVWDYQILGHAMAHEIGHLLLGANSHTATGIMRAFWRPEDFQRMAAGYLLFNADQRERMQTTLRSRAAEKQITESAARQP
ncbi:MAG TPA: hypothetical protein VI455_04080 [Terriglobia bacterium]